MLVITRKPLETFLLKNQQTGEEIKVQLLSFSNGQARIGIDAPKHVHILRDNAVKTIPDKEKGV